MSESLAGSSLISCNMSEHCGLTGYVTDGMSVMGPKDIGKLVRFLCSENASYITGTDILIDGGWTAQ